MKRYRAVMVMTAALAGCGGDKAAPPSPAVGQAESAPLAAEAAPPVADPAAGYVDIGIPECDQYARKYLACLERTPEGTRAMMRQSFDQTREVWSMAAEKPDRRAGVAAACAQQEKASKAAMSRYDCEW
jgi:hypothetical protein